MPFKYTLLTSALLSISLVGCGGGESTSPSLQAGHSFMASILVDGVEVQTKTYNTYSVVDDDGTLSDQSLGAVEESKLPHLWLLASISTSHGTTAPQQTVAQYQACYHDFWKSIRRQLPERSASYIVQRLNDFGMTIDEVCDRQAESGLSVDEYVALFRVVETYWPDNPDIDGKIARFFTNLKVSPSDFKATLYRLGYTWDDFVRRMASVDNGGNKFINEYRLSKLEFEPFLRDYMARFVVTSSGIQSAPTRLTAALASADVLATVTDVIDTVGKIFSISKTAWQFMRENQGVIETIKGDASARIVSAADASELNYEYAKASQSPVISFVGRSFVFGAWETFRTDLQLSVDYGATHRDFGGQWMPDLRVLVKKAQAPWGYKMAGDVVLSSVVNRGSATAPIPEVQVDVVMSVTYFSTVNQTFTFLANGATGAAYLP